MSNVDINSLGVSQTFTERMQEIVELVRALSSKTDPSELFQEYLRRISQIFPVDQIMLLRFSEADPEQVEYSIIKDWTDPIRLWEASDDYFPVSSPLLIRLMKNSEATIINDLPAELDEQGEPSLEGIGSLRAVPMFDQGRASKMVVGLKREINGFQQDELATSIWLSNMFGQTLKNLMMANDLQQAYEAVDRELTTVGEIQRSLLPDEIPKVDNLDLATYYEPSARAGGDYFDFFRLPDGKLGILIADVSGHGSPAAVVMAIIHTIAHTYTGSHDPPSEFLNYINCHLSRRYTAKNGVFVTAFYAVFDPVNRKLTYSSAGHNPPQRRGCGQQVVKLLDRAGRMPLGISEEITYTDSSEMLSAGDRVVLYTDGIIEAFGEDGEMFGMQRLGDIIGRCDLDSTTIVDEVLQELKCFTGTHRQNDDCTLVVMKVK